MNLLIDINHPAHVHYFRNTYKRLTAEGHKVVVISRNKDIEQELLRRYDIPFQTRGKGAKTTLGKIFYHIYAVFVLVKSIKKNKIDIVLSFMHPYGAQAAWLTRKKSILFSDTENANLHHSLSIPFATVVHTPECFERDLGKKHKRFNSFMELSYLGNKYFTPNQSILDQLQLKNDKPIVIIRFVSWNAVHDFGHQGVSTKLKIEMIKRLSKISNVFITSEGELPEELISYKLEIVKSEMHSLLFFSDLFIGESATMASESSMLGTPAIYIDNEGRGYTNFLQEKYGIVFNFKEDEYSVISAINEAVSILNSKKDYKGIGRSINSDSIDTANYIYQQVILLNSTV